MEEVAAVEVALEGLDGDVRGFGLEREVRGLEFERDLERLGFETERELVDLGKAALGSEEGLELT